METDHPEPRFSRSFLNKLVIFLIVTIAILNTLNDDNKLRIPFFSDIDNTLSPEHWTEPSLAETLFAPNQGKSTFILMLNAGYLQSPHHPKWPYLTQQLIKKRILAEQKKTPWLASNVTLDLEKISLEVHFDEGDLDQVSQLTTKIIRQLQLTKQPPYIPQAQGKAENRQRLFYSHLLQQQLKPTPNITKDTNENYANFIKRQLCLNNIKLVITGNLSKASAKRLQKDASQGLTHCKSYTSSSELTSQKVLFSRNSDAVMLGILVASKEPEQKLGLKLIQHMLQLKYSLQISEQIMPNYYALLVKSFSPYSYTKWQPIAEKIPDFLQDEQLLVSAKEAAKQEIINNSGHWLSLLDSNNHRLDATHPLLSPLLNIELKLLQKIWQTSIAETSMTRVNYQTSQ